MSTHLLKTWPEYFAPMQRGEKQFEIRFNDRDFKAGDLLLLDEFDPKTETYSDRRVIAEVTYVLTGPVFGLEPGWCVMSLNLTARGKRNVETQEQKLHELFSR